MKKLILIALLAAVPVQAEEVQLIWDENIETDLAGYRVYYHAEGEEYRQIDEVTSPGHIADYPVGQHWWRVTAFDEANNESIPSDSANYNVEEPVDETPPGKPSTPIRVTVIVELP